MQPINGFKRLILSLLFLNSLSFNAGRPDVSYSNNTKLFPICFPLSVERKALPVLNSERLWQVVTAWVAAKESGGKGGGEEGGPWGHKKKQQPMDPWWRPLSGNHQTAVGWGSLLFLGHERRTWGCDGSGFSWWMRLLALVIDSLILFDKGRLFFPWHGAEWRLGIWKKAQRFAGGLILSLRKVRS